MKVEKRDKTLSIFDSKKIYNAIKSAAQSINSIMSEEEITEISNSIEHYLSTQKTNDNDVVSIKTIERLVEDKLMESPYKDVARAYITYRYIHDKKREYKDKLMDAMYALTFKKAEEVNDKRDNANINTDTAMGTMLKYGTTTSNYFTDNYILPKDIADAFKKGEIHIHDKDFYNLTETCCQIDLNKLFTGGFNTGHGFLREPQSIQSYSSLACIVLQSNQNEMHGGQAIPAFDYYMAPGVVKTFKKELSKALYSYLVYNYASYPTTRNILNEAFKQIALDDIPKFNDDFHKMLNNILDKAEIDLKISIVSLKNIYIIAYNETVKATYQAMESFIHNLNSMHSRAGSQTVFSSINYGTDTSNAGRLVMKQLLLATQAGLGNHETPIFPIQIFKLKAGVNYNEDDPNYDLFKLAIETSAKRLFPNFSFIDAPFNLRYYDPTDINTEISYMGCRTRTIGNINGPEICTSRGNLSFTTINLPMLALEAKEEGKGKCIDAFKNRLIETMELVKHQLLHRYNIQCNRHAYNYPFLMGQGIWLDSDKLSENDTLEDVLKHGTLSIGFIGLAETLIALTGYHHGENEESQLLGLKIIKFMRDVCDKFSNDTHLNFSLFATPAEGLTGRFAKINKQRFGTIQGVTDKEYLTNSFHVPVYYKIKAAKKIDIEAPYHELTNAGHISYVEMDGDPSKNLEAFETIIRYMYKKGIGYGSINHPVDRDPVCGYTGIIENECPHCHRNEGIKRFTIKVKKV